MARNSPAEDQLLKRYKPDIEPQALRIPLRGLTYHVHHWGAGEPRRLFLLHGWGDSGRSFQFLVDALGPGWELIAPDWRGFGLSECHQDSYYFPDYLGDLDALVRHFDDGAPVRLLGHSMGGNIASLYAGVFPDKVSDLINVEGFGLAETDPLATPAHYRRWLKSLHKTDIGFSPYSDPKDLVPRIKKRSPAMPDDRALFVAEQWLKRQPDSTYALRTDAAHRSPNPVRYRRDEAMACWADITARVALVRGEYETLPGILDGLAGMRQQMAGARIQDFTVAGAGHMVHFEKAEELAQIVNDFLC